MVKIYTKTGDSGDTSLCGGMRTSKDSLRVESYGTIDELDSFIGLAIVKMTEEDIAKHLIEIQKDLLTLGANLAYPESLDQSSISGDSFASKIPRITKENIRKLEIWIDEYHTELPPLKHFIISGGGNECSALLHTARAIARRAERRIVTLKKNEEVDSNVLKYVNRLSDYLFTAGRVMSKRLGNKDMKWYPKTNRLDKYISEKENTNQKQENTGNNNTNTKNISEDENTTLQRESSSLGTANMHPKTVAMNKETHEIINSR